MNLIETFKEYLRNTPSQRGTLFSPASREKYSGAISTISKEMIELGAIPKHLMEMSLSEFNEAYSLIQANTAFVEKNNTGNAMYSSALKHYLEFIKLSALNIPIGDKEEENITLDSPASEREAIIRARITQTSFRRELLQKYKKCMITDIENPALLVASHIKPWSKSNDFERSDLYNGLLLSANMDKLFDRGYISFMDSGQLLISPQIVIADQKRLNLTSSIRVSFDEPSARNSYLSYHRENLFKDS